MNTLAVAGRWSPPRGVDEVGDQLWIKRIPAEISGHPPAADNGFDRLGFADLRFVAQRAPSFSRSSAMTQPWATSEPPFFGLTVVNSAASSGLIFSGFSAS